MADQHTFQTRRMLLGIVMTFAILDHTRLFFHYWNTNPADLDHTTYALFFTRFTSHYFAPAVFFITGIELYLTMGKNTKRQNAGHLFKLGSVLMLIEVFINNFLYTFDPYYRTIGVFIIGSLGLCLLCMTGLQYFSRNLILLISLAIILGHHLLDPIQMKGDSINAVLWYLLHQQKFIPRAHSMYIVNYTLLPWLGVLSLGFFWGFFYRSESNPIIRKKLLLYTGWTSVCVFFLLRSMNSYGDPNPWLMGTSPISTVLSFFNLTKYPASLDYLTITLGPVLLFLAYTENWKNKVVDFFFVLGRHPLFIYLLSTFIIHLTAMLWLYIQGKPLQMMVITAASYGNQSPLLDYGYSLTTVYFLWGSFVLICYLIAKKTRFRPPSDTLPEKYSIW